MAAVLLAALIVMPVPAQVPHPTEHEAALLYATHCRACHTEQVHWRDAHKVKDWPGLVSEVRRWQRNLGLAWSDDEIRQVAHYLNLLHYRFAPPPPRVLAARP
jgi:hypothetical protein